MNDDDDLASELDQSGLGQQIQNLNASKQASCFHYLAAMPHRPLNPSMMLSTEPAMKAPCVALIACRNLCKEKGEKKSSFVNNVSKARRQRE
jgi:hypothetical protein